MFASVKEPHVHLRQDGVCAERMQPRNIPFCSLHDRTLHDRTLLFEKRKILPSLIPNDVGFGMGAFVPNEVFIQRMFSWFGRVNRF